MATLDETQLKFGQMLQLQLVRLEQTRLYAKLIGYLVNQAIIVTAPTLADQPYPILEGEALVCRAFAGRLAVGFETAVIRVTQQPFGHMYLTYPRDVASVVVRKTPRLAIQREAALLKTTEQGEVREAATVIDISMTGSCALAKPEFAAVKDSLTLLLPANKPEETEIRLTATVRSARLSQGSGSAPGCQYGMEFVNMTPEQTQALEKLIQQQLAQSL